MLPSGALECGGLTPLSFFFSLPKAHGQQNENSSAVSYRKLKERRKAAAKRRTPKCMKERRKAAAKRRTPKKESGGKTPHSKVHVKNVLQNHLALAACC